MLRGDKSTSLSTYRTRATSAVLPSMVASDGERAQGDARADIQALSESQDVSRASAAACQAARIPSGTINGVTEATTPSNSRTIEPGEQRAQAHEPSLFGANQSHQDQGEQHSGRAEPFGDVRALRARQRELARQLHEVGAQLHSMAPQGEVLSRIEHSTQHAQQAIANDSEDDEFEVQVDEQDGSHDRDALPPRGSSQRSG